MGFSIDGFKFAGCTAGNLSHLVAESRIGEIAVSQVTLLTK